MGTMDITTIEDTRGEHNRLTRRSGRVKVASPNRSETLEAHQSYGNHYYYNDGIVAPPIGMNYK